MKHREASRPPQASLILRLLGGGYLLYLAYGLLDAASDSLLYAAALAVFALVGVTLVLHSGLKLYRKEYAQAQDETTTDEEQTDEQ